MALVSQLIEGYSIEQFFIELPPNFICGICNKVARDAVECPSGQHFFCESCVQRSRYAQCACCIVNLNSKSLKANKGARDVVNSQKIRCIFDNCSWQGRVSDYYVHQAMECEYVRCACPRQCGYVIPRYQLREHEKFCPNASIVCTHCTASVVQSEITEHLRHCPMVVIPCPNQCLKLVTRANLVYHREHQCSRRLVNCTLPHHCQEIFVAEDLEEHIAKYQQEEANREARLRQQQQQQQQQQQLAVARSRDPRPAASVSREAVSYYGPGLTSFESSNSNSREARNREVDREVDRDTNFRRRDISPPTASVAGYNNRRGSRADQDRSSGFPASVALREAASLYKGGNARDRDERDNVSRRRDETNGRRFDREGYYHRDDDRSPRSDRDHRDRDRGRDYSARDDIRGQRSPNERHSGSRRASNAEQPSTETYQKETVVSYHICNVGKGCGCQFSEPYHVCNGTNCKCDRERARHICNATICSCTYVNDRLSSHCRCTFAINRHICNGGRNCICSVTYREHICNATPNCNCCFDPAMHLCFSV